MQGPRRTLRRRDRLVRDDFAGAGGWDVALAALGVHDVVGYDNNAAACATGRAAGFVRVEGDLRLQRRVFQRLWGYVASPSCQTFSAAGKGNGRKHLADLLRAAERVAEGVLPEDAVAHLEGLDERGALSLEPLHVVVTRRPEWTCWEQVPAVLPLWEKCAELLREAGYSVWTGCLQSETFGVPQTRRRAVLIASRVRTVGEPQPTHTKYRKGKPACDGTLLPWVSMADALGWGMTARPSVTVTGGSSRTGNIDPLDGGTGSRTTVNGERAAGRWGHKPLGSGTGAQRTILNETANGNWTEPTDEEREIWENRPATTVVGTFAANVIAGPGYRKAGDGPRQNAKGSVRVTVQEAGVLQSFPAPYPWTGSKGEQHLQVGNAIPVLLAQAVVREALGLGPVRWPAREPVDLEEAPSQPGSTAPARRRTLRHVGSGSQHLR